MDAVMNRLDFPCVIETIKGVIHQMARPNLNHIKASGKLYWLFMNYFIKYECELLAEPLVRLDDDEVVPDICVVCDKTKLKRTRIVGAPDLIIEILSPSTRKKDIEEKYPLYEKHGVREYWLVDPTVGSVEIYVLGSDGKYEIPRSYPFQTEEEKKDLIKYGRAHAIVEELSSVIFPELTIQLSELFSYIEQV